jgi:hypothetical protein
MQRERGGEEREREVWTHHSHTFLKPHPDELCCGPISFLRNADGGRDPLLPLPPHTCRIVRVVGVPIRCKPIRLNTHVHACTYIYVLCIHLLHMKLHMNVHMHVCGEPKLRCEPIRIDHHSCHLRSNLPPFFSHYLHRAFAGSPSLPLLSSLFFSLSQAILLPTVLPLPTPFIPPFCPTLIHYGVPPHPFSLLFSLPQLLSLSSLPSHLISPPPPSPHQKSPLPSLLLPTLLTLPLYAPPPTPPP